MLTIFACPKSFGDPHIATIQRNAITSWTALCPTPEIILIGSDNGVAEAAHDINARHISEVKTNEYGTPLVNDIFRIADEVASHPVLAYVNSDMILMSDFIDTVNQVISNWSTFLAVGSRWNINLTNLFAFHEPDWEKRLTALVASQGTFSYWGVDYFVFPKNFYKSVPPFAIGRIGFDGWLIRYARRVNAPLIDVTKTVKAVHQNHDHSHVVSQGDWTEGPETKVNERLSEMVGFLNYATYESTPQGFRRIRFRIMGYRARSWLHRWFLRVPLSLISSTYRVLFKSLIN